MPTTKIAVMGGSSISSPTFVAALAKVENAAGLEVVLHGRSAEKLDLVGRVSAQVGRREGLVVRWTTSLDDALEGSDVVVNQIRVGGMSGRQFDEQFPRRFGLIGEETLGAGGFSSAVRTIPVVRSLCEAIAERSPHARILNLTNPAGMVLGAIARCSDLTAVSVCDIPVALTRAAAAAADLDPSTVEVDYLGVNHLGWLTDVRTPDSASIAASVFPALRVSMRTLPADWLEDLGVIPGPYLRYVYRPEANVGASEGPTRATELLAVESDVLEQFAALADLGDVDKLAAAASARGAHWYEEIVVPAIAALTGDDARPLILQSPNAGLLPWLPDDAIVEMPSLLGPGGVHSRRPGDLPADCRAVLAENAVYETLAVEAIITGSWRAARRALVTNRLVGTIEKANAVLGACWPQDLGDRRG
jgi:6-phospho-beta-glucosidase